jgi:iron complex outermembrane receptor protein
LFGRNTIGGAINIVTIQPELDTLSASFQGTYGSRDRVDVLAAANLPISPQLAARASAFVRNQRGWGRNVYTGDTFGDIDEVGGRLKLLFEPSDDFRVTISGDYLRGRGSPSHQVLLGTNLNAGITVRAHRSSAAVLCPWRVADRECGCRATSPTIAPPTAA